MKSRNSLSAYEEIDVVREFVLLFEDFQEFARGNTEFENYLRIRAHIYVLSSFPRRSEIREQTHLRWNSLVFILVQHCLIPASGNGVFRVLFDNSVRRWLVIVVMTALVVVPWTTINQCLLSLFFLFFFFPSFFLFFIMFFFQA